MELINLLTKVAFTMVFLPWVFIASCNFCDFEPNLLIKGVAVFALIIGFVIGVFSIVWRVWAL